MQNTGELPGEGGLQDSVLGLAGHHKLRSSFRYVDGPLLRRNIFSKLFSPLQVRPWPRPGWPRVPQPRLLRQHQPPERHPALRHQVQQQRQEVEAFNLSGRQDRLSHLKMTSRSASTASHFVAASRLSMPDLSIPGLNNNTMFTPHHHLKQVAARARYLSTRVSTISTSRASPRTSLTPAACLSTRRCLSTTSPASASTLTRPSSSSRATAPAACPSTSTGETLGGRSEKNISRYAKNI